MLCKILFEYIFVVFYFSDKFTARKHLKKSQEGRNWNEHRTFEHVNLIGVPN